MCIRDRAVIPGAIVQDDEFNVFIGLVQDAADAAGQMVLSVVHGQDEMCIRDRYNTLTDQNWCKEELYALCIPGAALALLCPS